LATIGLCLLLAGCGAPDSSDTRLDAFGQEIESGFRRRDPQPFIGAFNNTALVARVLEGVDVSPPTRLRMETEVTGFVQELGRKVAQTLGARGIYLYRGHRDVDDGEVLVFRMLDPNSRLNYHELLVGRAQDDTMQVDDVYIYLAGEWLSETIRRGFLGMWSRTADGSDVQLSTEESEYASSLPAIQQMLMLTRSGRAADALALYGSLPESVQRDRSVLTIRVQAAQQLGDEVYGDALDAFEAALPDDPAWLLVSLEAYFLRGEEQKLMDSFRRLQQRVGPDGYLHYLRGGILVRVGDTAGARQAFEDGISAEPELAQPYLGLVHVALGEGDFEAVGREVERLEGALGRDFSTLADVEGFREIVESDAYREWLLTRSGP
jgi:tetratricopeptide (TPR) repeat protein